MAITDLTGTKWVFDNTVLPSSSSFVSYSINGQINSMQSAYEINSICVPLDSSYYSGENVLSIVTWYSFIGQTSNGGWHLFDFESEEVAEDFGNSMEIEITGGTDATNSTLIQWFEANATQIVEPSANTYTITHTLTNVNKGNITLQLTPDTGYELPDTITVTNGTLVSYDKTTGIAVISGDDNTSVSVECVASAPSGHSVTFSTVEVSGREAGTGGFVVGVNRSDISLAVYYTDCDYHLQADSYGTGVWKDTSDTTINSPFVVNNVTSLSFMSKSNSFTISIDGVQVVNCPESNFTVYTINITSDCVLTGTTARTD